MSLYDTLFQLTYGYLPSADPSTMPPRICRPSHPANARYHVYCHACDRSYTIYSTSPNIESVSTIPKLTICPFPSCGHVYNPCYTCCRGPNIGSFPRKWYKPYWKCWACGEENFFNGDTRTDVCGSVSCNFRKRGVEDGAIRWKWKGADEMFLRGRNGGQGKN